jgi:hypothetical protein
MMWLLSQPLHPPPPQVISLSQSSRVTPVEITYGEGEGVGEEPNHIKARKTSPLQIIQSALGWALLGKAAWKQWQGLKASITNTKV